MQKISASEFREVPCAEKWCNYVYYEYKCSTRMAYVLYIIYNVYHTYVIKVWLKM
jgi:hypothetical protein